MTKHRSEVRQEAEKRRQEGLQKAWEQYRADQRSPNPAVRDVAGMVWDRARWVVFQEYAAALRLLGDA